MNTITIELCQEDRARLDRILKALENQTPHCDKCVQTLADVVKDVTPITAQETPQEATEAQTPETVKPKAKKATGAKAEPVAAAQSVEPTVTLEQIQQKVVQLAAAGAEKKAKVRAIINKYGAKVSDLKGQPDKWDEVWAELTALEG